MEQRARDLATAMQWTSDSDANDSAKASKANAMADALKWLRENAASSDLMENPDAAVLGFVGDLDGPQSLAAANTLEWLLSGGVGNDTIDNEEKTRKNNAVSEKESKIKEKTDALDWIKSEEINLSQVDTDTLESFRNLASLQMPKGVLTDEDKSKGLQDTLDWMRNNNLDLDEVQDRTVKVLSELTGNPLYSPKLEDSVKSQVMEDALQWLRKGKADLSKIDKNVAEFVTSLADLPKPKGFSPDKNKKKMKKALKLLEKNEPNFDNVDMDDKKITALAKAAGLNLQPPTFSKEVKAKVIDDVMLSLKAKKLGLYDVNHSTLDLFSDLTGLEMPKGELTDEMKGSAMDEALKTIRDDRNELILSNLNNDPLAAPNLADANEQLARKLEDALDWVRNERVASKDEVDDRMFDVFSTIAIDPNPEYKKD